MSNNTDTKIYVFTEEKLRDRDLKIIKFVAETVSKASVIHTARKMIKMNSGQQLQAMTKNCKSLEVDKEKMDKIVVNLVNILND